MAGMSKRVPSGPSPYETSRTIQIAVRMPKDLLAEVRARGSVTKQVIEALQSAHRAAAEKLMLDSAVATMKTIASVRDDAPTAKVKQLAIRWLREIEPS